MPNSLYIQILHRETGEILRNVPGESLVQANLHGANLRGANLQRQNLERADLSAADLTGADLTEANLAEANLTQAKVSDADLTRSHLRSANFSQANLTGAILNQAHLMYTVWADCPTLHKALGLSEVDHFVISILDARTLRYCISDLPDQFLQGVGYTNEEIENLRAMYRQGIQYYSCFISYAHANRDFATYLHEKLIAANVSCWMDVHDMQGGDFWRKQINEAIKMHEKLIVACSQKSLSRKEVVEEIIEAIEHERETGAQKLFPVRLDDFLFTKEAEEWAYKTLPPRQRREDWLTYLRDYHVPNFSNWKDFDTFMQEFEKLLNALKNPAKR